MTNTIFTFTSTRHEYVSSVIVGLSQAETNRTTKHTTGSVKGFARAKAPRAPSDGEACHPERMRGI